MQDDSKSLTYSEFRSVLTQTGDPLTQEEVSQFFALVDKDQDGMLNIDEFMHMLYPPTEENAHDLTRLREPLSTENIVSDNADAFTTLPARTARLSLPWGLQPRRVSSESVNDAMPDGEI